MTVASGSSFLLMVCVITTHVSSAESVRRPIVLASQSIDTRLLVCDFGNSETCLHGLPKTALLEFSGCDGGEPESSVQDASSRSSESLRNKVREDGDRIPHRSTETVRALRALHALVQFTDEDSQSSREDVRDRLFKDVHKVGGRILNYVPVDSYLVLLPCVKAARSLSRLSYVSWIGRLRGESKLAPEWGPILRHYKTADDIKEESSIYDMIDVDKEGRPLVTVVLPDQGPVGSSEAYASFIHSSLCEKFSHLRQPVNGSDSVGLPDPTVSSSAVNHSSDSTHAGVTQHANRPKNLDDPRTQLLETSDSLCCSTFGVSLEGISTTIHDSSHDVGSSAADSIPHSTTSDTTQRHHHHHQHDVITSQGLLVLAAPKPLLPAVLRWLQQQGWVQWMAPRPRSRLHNRWASAVTQSGTSVGLDDDPGFGSPASASGGGGGEQQRSGFRAARPLWSAGITGSGQIVGIGDSGIDMQ
ncbi:unnamed protein product, partial [Closterium sp. NIES-53]